MRHILPTAVVTGMACFASAVAPGKDVLAPSAPRSRESAAQVVTPKSNLAPTEEFSAFSHLRSEVLNTIAGAGRRVWLVTDYLTDGDIVSALYIAKYRHLDVTVLLGRSKANAYMSRLSYLKSQDIPVYLAPSSWTFPDSTAILADDRLISINGSLDFMNPQSRYLLKQLTDRERQSFIEQFSAAANQKVPAVAAPSLDAGRPTWRPRSTTSTARVPAREDAITTTYSGESDGTFNYNRVRHPREAPGGMPRKLPSQTILQKKSQSSDKE